MVMRMVVLLGFLSFSASGGAIAQTQCNTIIGRVTMEDARVLSAATILAKNSKSKKIEKTHSDNKGEYSLCLSPGKYDFSASAPGFLPKHRKSLWIDLVPGRAVDFVLTFNNP
jgi:hypothetical protein